MDNNNLTTSIIKGKLPVMKQEIHNDFTQGRFKVEFPPESSNDEIDLIQKQVFKLLERHSCKVVRL